MQHPAEIKHEFFEPRQPDFQPPPSQASARKKQRLKDGEPLGENQICVVCGDYASGFHYSALTCEACKSFFKRTVQVKHEYTCSGNHDCSVSKSMRKSCQYCRFQKCLNNGMLPQDVRVDRTRGGRKKCKRTSREQFDQLVEQISINPDPPNSSDLVPMEESVMEEQFDVKDNLTTMRNFDETSSTDADPLDNFIREAITNDNLVRPITIAWSRSPSSTKSQAAFNFAISEWFNRGLESAVTWSNSLKCLDVLLLQDRMSLLAKNWFAVLLMDTLARSVPFGGTIHFASNFVLHPDDVASYEPPNDFYSTMKSMFASFDQLQLNRNELSVLKLLALFDHSVIDDIGVISRTEPLRAATLRALYRVCSEKLDLDEQSEKTDMYVSKLLLRQGFTVNLKMGLESWHSLEPPTSERVNDLITKGLGILLSPQERSSPEDDCTSTDSCPDQFRSRIYFKTLRAQPGASSNDNKNNNNNTTYSSASAAHSVHSFGTPMSLPHAESLTMEELASVAELGNDAFDTGGFFDTS